MKPLPIIISVPHGGMTVPQDIKPLCSLNDQDILLDGDTWTRQLYSYQDQVSRYIDTDIARAIVDLNRAADDLPPKNPDGVVKTYTVQKKPIWIDSEINPLEIKDYLIKRFYYPYHNDISLFTQSDPNIKFGVDCHSMLALAPDSDSYNPIKRPDICVSNRGNEEGGRMDESLTIDQEPLIYFYDQLQACFYHQDLQLNINNPFKGGYISRYHSQNDNIPWIQLEISRALYLQSETLDDLEPDLISMKKLKDLKQKLFKAISNLYWAF